MNPTLAVVIVTYNSARVIGPLLRSLPQALDGVENAEVFVVDNGSTDPTLAEIDRYGMGVRVCQTGANLGYAAACNTGIRLSGDAAAVLLLNADLRLPAGSIRPLLDVITRRAHVGIAVPKLLDDQGSTATSLRRDPTVLRAWGAAVCGGKTAGRYQRLGEVVNDPVCYQRPGRTDWATGAALLISRACLNAIGSLDESFFLYSEETDLALRARDAGFGVWFEPRSVITHLGGESGSDAGLWSLLTVNRVRLFSRRHGAVASALFWLGTLVNEVLRFGRGQHHRSAVTGLLQPWHWGHPRRRLNERRADQTC